MYWFIYPLIFLVPQDSNLTLTRKSVDCGACYICHCSARVGSQNNLFPASLLFAGTFSASLNGFSSGFLVSSLSKHTNSPNCRFFCHKDCKCHVSRSCYDPEEFQHFPRYWLTQHHGNLFCWKA